MTDLIPIHTTGLFKKTAWVPKEFSHLATLSWHWNGSTLIRYATTRDGDPYLVHLADEIMGSPAEPTDGSMVFTVERLRPRQETRKRIGRKRCRPEAEYGFHKSRTINKFIVQFCHQEKRYYGGVFEDEAEARKKRDELAAQAGVDPRKLNVRK